MKENYLKIMTYKFCGYMLLRSGEAGLPIGGENGI
jgi:hypothetical protein